MWRVSGVRFRSRSASMTAAGFPAPQLPCKRPVATQPSLQGSRRKKAARPDPVPGGKQYLPSIRGRLLPACNGSRDSVAAALEVHGGFETVHPQRHCRCSDGHLRRTAPNMVRMVRQPGRPDGSFGLIRCRFGHNPSITASILA